MNNIKNIIKTPFYNRHFWEDIDQMPINSWRLILETGDLKHVFKKGKGRVTERTANKWLELQQQYIDEFGLDDKYKELLRLQKKLTLLNLEYIETRDRFLFNLISMAEKDIKAFNTKESIKFGQTLDHIEKYKGFFIDPEKISVKRWYYTLKNMAENGN